MPSLVSDLISSAITLSRAASIAASTSSTVAVRLGGFAAMTDDHTVAVPRRPGRDASPPGARPRCHPQPGPSFGLDSTSMPRYGPDRIRNVAILGHSHEGKTTLAEAMLFITGAIGRMGSTDAGTAALDFEPEEQKRKISINLAIASVEHDDHKVNLLDTPGFFDFAAQVTSALTVAEGAIVVVGATAQVSVGTEIAWERLNRRSGPRLVVVNKMDKEHADFRGAVDLMRMKAYLDGPDGITEAPVPESLLGLAEERREQLIEAAAEGDDSLLEKYLDEGTLSDEEVVRGLRAGVAAGRVCPALCCSALKLIGVRPLLRAVCELLPRPRATSP